ncbi:MAG: DNA repair protein RadC [Acetobacter sp.]|nr:DNA repair protein RadC [Bacteroides sp.]MCM1341433.1 DNA repair protein RadC [Acetobacter sp.]MCM1433387.1 DNA repair protein RadC [Clostridiales bacterium]
MKKLNQEGHRGRLKESFLYSELDNIPEHNLLELYLTTCIPRKDVKPLAYDLITKFGSLKGVLNASIQDLKTVDGIGEVTATSIYLVKRLVMKSELLDNSKIKYLSSQKTANDYCENLFAHEEIEKLYMVSLDNQNRIINKHLISEGTASETAMDYAAIISSALLDKASSIMLFHNHPNGSKEPSANDINCTLELKNSLAKVHIRITDHIIYGADGCISLKSRSPL